MINLYSVHFGTGFWYIKNMSSKKPRNRVLWQTEYRSNGTALAHVVPIGFGDYAIRKVLTSPPGYYNRLVERYQVSVSPERRSWYDDFDSFQSAKRFARQLLINRK